MDYTDEKNLINDLLLGKESAFRYVVKATQSSMLYVARSIAGPLIAEDIVQEAWVSIIKALLKFEGRSSLKTWSLTIVRNTAVTRIKKESRHIAVGDARDVEEFNNTKDRYNENGSWSDPPRHWNSESPDILLANDELMSVIKSAIEKLPEKQQAVISLKEMEGIPMNEICNTLNISDSNSRVLLHRARVSIWQAIELYEGNPNVELQGIKPASK